MPTAPHQWLLLWAARRMTADGFLVGGFEAEAPQAGCWNALPPPFVIAGVRPDGWGIRMQDSLLAFAEAKTSDDIDTKHTRNQLQVFGFTNMRQSAQRCPLYVAIPRSCAYLLDRVLADLGLISARNVVRLHIPDVLLQG
jgi:hypothetical protein